MSAYAHVNRYNRVREFIGLGKQVLLECRTVDLESEIDILSVTNITTTATELYGCMGELKKNRFW